MGPELNEVPPFEMAPPRLRLTPPGELDAPQRAVYDAITGGPRAIQAGTVPITDEEGRLVGPFAVMLLSPAVGNAIQQVGVRIRFSTALTGRERELGILTVAGALRCDFERLAHEPAARDLGFSPDQVSAVLTGRVPDGLTGDETMVCRLAQAMVTGWRLRDEDYDAGLAALGEARLADLTWLVGYYAALALALAVFRPVLPDSLSPARDGGSPE